VVGYSLNDGGASFLARRKNQSIAGGGVSRSAAKILLDLSQDPPPPPIDWRPSVLINPQIVSPSCNPERINAASLNFHARE
jgi:hypothetical protein